MAMAPSVAGAAAAALEPPAGEPPAGDGDAPPEPSAGDVQAQIVPVAAQPLLFGPGESPAWLCAYHGCGQGAPVWPFVGCDSPFKVEKISHTGYCHRANQQHKKSIAKCDDCFSACKLHNESLAGRTGVGGGGRTVNPMATTTGVFHGQFAPELCAKIGSLAYGLFSDYDAETQQFSCADFPASDSGHPDLRGFDGFELVQGVYSAEQQGKSCILLHPASVAALGVVCPELPRLIADHAATMPADTVVAHHTLLFQGVDNPGVVFDWHTDTRERQPRPWFWQGRADSNPFGLGQRRLCRVRHGGLWQNSCAVSSSWGCSGFRSALRPQVN